MGLVGVAVLIISIAFLAYTYPPMFRNYLPEWLTGSSQQNGTSKSETSDHGDRSSAVLGDGSTSEGDATPKAKPEDSADEVPVLTLSNDDEQQHNEDQPEEPAVPSFAAANSAQGASAMLPPPRPSNTQSSRGLMPPPARPTPASTLSTAASLRVPTTGPLPNRGPPASSQQRVSTGGLSPNGVVKTSNTRGKVLLSPGHSPMDWAALTRSGNLSGVGSFQRVTPSHLKTMTGRKGKPAWSIWQGKVYNITPYLPFHPGGEAELMKAAGRDGTKLFMDIHPWVNWENMLGSCLVGVMVPEDFGNGGSSLEEMD